MRERALTRLRAGDYLCVSNDLSTVYRFRSYGDGRAAGLLDVAYEWRTFWSVSSVPFDDFMDAADVDGMEWRTHSDHHPSRRAALESVYGPDPPR